MIDVWLGLGLLVLLVAAAVLWSRRQRSPRAETFSSLMSELPVSQDTALEAPLPESVVPTDVPAQAHANADAEQAARLQPEQAVAEAQALEAEQARREADAVDETRRRAEIAEAEAARVAAEAAAAAAAAAAEVQARLDAEQRAQREAEEQTRRAAAQREAAQEAERRQRAEEAAARAAAERQAAAEAARAEAARRTAQILEERRLEQARLDAEAAARREAEQLARRAAEETARREAELAQQREAELAAQLAAQRADQQAQQQALYAARKQAEEAAALRRQAEAQAAAGARAAQTPPLAAAPRSPGATLVLVADDSKVVRVKTSRLLAQHHYRVALAEDGLDAMRQIEAELPHVLITDVEMPGLDGFELTRRVRSHPRSAHIPVIMITSADDRLQGAAQAAGVSVLLGKPYSEQDLIARIEASLQAVTAAA
ncbi:MAG: response regulator [Burkholderiales bacterium]|nr:response regulator [Burkholderiales bacterium]